MSQRLAWENTGKKVRCVNITSVWPGPMPETSVDPWRDSYLHKRGTSDHYLYTGEDPGGLPPSLFIVKRG